MPPRVFLHQVRPLPEAGSAPPPAAFARALARAGAARGEVNLILTDALEVRRLNREFRGEDSETDVIAFDYLSDWALGRGSEAGSAAGARGRSRPRHPADHVWGDVFVSAEAALAQARERGIPATEELARLFLHGCLHLAGYRDETPAEAERMTAVQEELLAPLLAEGRTRAHAGAVRRRAG